MRGQQVLHDVQTLCTVEVCRLARQHVEFVRRYSLLETLTTFTGRGSPGDTLQLNHFRAFTGFLRDVVAGDFTAQYVIRRNVADHIPFRCLTVKGDYRDLRLVCHLHGITDRVGIGWVDQQDFGATNG